MRKKKVEKKTHRSELETVEKITFERLECTVQCDRAHQDRRRDEGLKVRRYRAQDGGVDDEQELSDHDKTFPPPPITLETIVQESEDHTHSCVIKTVLSITNPDIIPLLVFWSTAAPAQHAKRRKDTPRATRDDENDRGNRGEEQRDVSCDKCSLT